MSTLCSITFIQQYGRVHIKLRLQGAAVQQHSCRLIVEQVV